MFREMEYIATEQFLKQYLTYSAEKNKKVSVERYIALKFPELAQKLELNPVEKNEEVKKIHELSPEELKKLTLEAYQNSPEKDAILIKGYHSYTHEDLMREIRMGTVYGHKLINNHQGYLRDVVIAIEQGKVRKPTEEDLMPLSEKISKYRDEFRKKSSTFE